MAGWGGAANDPVDVDQTPLPSLKLVISFGMVWVSNSYNLSETLKCAESGEGVCSDEKCNSDRTSLVVQWLDSELPMPEIRVRSLVREVDPTRLS